jgi:hypothetical protein
MGELEQIHFSILNELKMEQKEAAAKEEKDLKAIAIE